jgi:hypothetical protein
MQYLYLFELHMLYKNKTTYQRSNRLHRFVLNWHVVILHPKHRCQTNIELDNNENVQAYCNALIFFNLCLFREASEVDQKFTFWSVALMVDRRPRMRRSRRNVTVWLLTRMIRRSDESMVNRSFLAVFWTRLPAYEMYRYLLVPSVYSPERRHHFPGVFSLCAAVSI